MDINEILKSGFDDEIEVEEDRENLTWVLITPTFFIICKQNNYAYTELILDTCRAYVSRKGNAVEEKQSS